MAPLWLNIARHSSRDEFLRLKNRAVGRGEAKNNVRS